jgi:hypothetical protein
MDDLQEEFENKKQYKKRFATVSVLILSNNLYQVERDINYKFE